MLKNCTICGIPCSCSVCYRCQQQQPAFDSLKTENARLQQTLIEIDNAARGRFNGENEKRRLEKVVAVLDRVRAER